MEKFNDRSSKLLLAVEALCLLYAARGAIALFSGVYDFTPSHSGPVHLIGSSARMMGLADISTALFVGAAALLWLKENRRLCVLLISLGGLGAVCGYAGAFILR